jgi:glutathione reductase (NADPH)
MQNPHPCPLLLPVLPACCPCSLSEEQAIKQLSGTIDVYTSKFKPMKYTVSGRDERTFMKLLVHAGSDRVVGCHM